MKTFLSLLTLVAVTAGLQTGVGAAPAQSVEWAGAGRYRILLRVDPVDIRPRQSDEMPAEISLDLSGEMSRRLNVKGRLDPASIQVVEYDPLTGRPIRFEKNAYGRAAFDLPFRWYDDSIPYDFPEFEGRVAATNGQTRPWKQHAGWGYLYGTLGEGGGGRLAWVHTQKGEAASYYAVYFDLLREGASPTSVPPQGFVGDASERREPSGESTTGLIHSRVAADDWNGDGLVDLLVGSARGGLVVYPNTGTRSKPRFTYSKLVFTDDGYPLDVGLTAAPLVVDWDRDGAKDLLIGAQSNRLLFYKNVGTNGKRRLVNKGFVSADGKPVALPHEPVPEGNGVFKDDYYPIPEVVDWDGDGDFDLLAGGYVTGMVFSFENVGRNADGTPVLKSRGPLMAGGKPLDVGWCAAPTAGDFDGDGDPDLIVGSLPKTDEGSDSVNPATFLNYFENVGTRREPALAKRPFPKKGAFPSSSLSTPRAVDLNSDGLLDLVVSAQQDIYLFDNSGTRSAPQFDAHESRLPSAWGTASVVDIGTQLVDWNGDGRFDLLSRFSVRINKAPGYPGVFSSPTSVLPPGEKISHPAPMGDDYAFIRAADLDADGQLDILFGDHQGHVYFHRNLSAGRREHFDTTGVKLQTTDGKPIKVGPQGDEAMNFQVLQGARTTFDLADFDRDGRLDLVVGDTYGKVRFYRNEGAHGGLVFAPPALIGDMKSRMAPVAVDWTNDGYPDVIGATAGGRIELFVNEGGGAGKTTFKAGEQLKLPAIPYWPAISVADWNGDGDNDVIIATGYAYTVLVERSFLEHGYAKGSILEVETRAPAPERSAKAGAR